MLLKLFGLLDIIAGIGFALTYFGVLERVAIGLAVFVILKGIVFFADISSFIDIIAGIFLLFSAFGTTTIFSIILALWLFQKGFFSFTA